MKFIDLFAGIGGFRIGFEQAAKDSGLVAECVFTSEIKSSALATYSSNFEPTQPVDLTKFDPARIPDFEVLLAGFPCQAFSSAGKRNGFMDARGTLFFDIVRVLKEKKPKALILENVEGLVNHDQSDPSEPFGKTLRVIINNLQGLGYKVSWQVLDASKFGLAQTRKRIFIVGHLEREVSLNDFPQSRQVLGDVLEPTARPLKSKTVDLLLQRFELSQLKGKSLKDKRGGPNNIHSWDINLKGPTSPVQRELLGALLRARRNKKWGSLKGIQWMDGMPLTASEISTFFEVKNLEELLEDLRAKGYLSLEHPKDLIEVEEEGVKRQIRQAREDLPKGYNIVAGKLSFEVSKFLDEESCVPTLVATDAEKMAVVQKNGVRRLTHREMLRLFGFPEDFRFPTELTDRQVFDLMGNTVAVNVVRAVSNRVLSTGI